MKKIYNDRTSILNGVVVGKFIIDEFETLIKHGQNGMTYLKLEGKEENFNKLDKLILDAKGSRKT